MKLSCTIFLSLFAAVHCFCPQVSKSFSIRTCKNSITTQSSSLKMNFFEDAFRFLSNMNKEASAKHILMSGPDASKKLELLKTELIGTPDVSSAFSELASKVNNIC
jgi:hypothetical protein